MDTTASKKRDAIPDTIKLCLITLVVLGHLIPRINTDGRLINEIIYSFHMPLFIFISGYYSRKKDIESFLKDILNLCIPLLIMETLSAIILHGNVPHFAPYWTLWYLLSLVYWKTLIQILPTKITDKTKVFLFSAIIIGLISRFIHLGYPLSSQRSLTFLPFFIGGYCSRKKDIITKIRKLKHSWSIALIIPSLILFTQIHKSDPMTIYRGASSLPLSFHGVALCIYSSLLAIINSVIFIRYIPQNRALSKLGQFTMPIYLFHGITIIAISKALSIIGLPHISLIWSIPITIAIIYLCISIDKMTIFHRISKPIG